MNKRFMTIIISLFIAGLIGIIGYHTYDFIKFSKKIDNSYDTSVKNSEKLLLEQEKQLKSAKEHLNNIEKYNTLYGFYYSPKIDKVVFKEYKITKEKYTLSTILKTLQSDESKEIDNIYNKIKINDYNEEEGMANLDISFKGWSKLSKDEKYQSLQPLLWTLYTSSNAEMINLTIDGQIIQFDERTPYDIYNRSYVNPLNDTEKYNDDNYNTFMYIPMVYSFKEGFYYIETNITNDDGEMRVILDKIGKKYKMPIKSIEYETDPIYQIVKYSIILENETYIAGFGGADKELVSDLSKAFKLSVPAKHYLVINEEVQPNPVFNHQSYKNNPIIKQ